MVKEAILHSAGLDSFILKHYLDIHGHKFDCLYFNHGGRYVKNEVKYLDSYVKIITNLNLRDIEALDAFIPNRNILMSVMANSMGYDKIWIGGSASDRVNDNNEKVFEQLSDFLTKMNGRVIKVDSPFWHVYKEDMIEWFLKNGGKIHDLAEKTFSCFEPLKTPQNIQLTTQYTYQTTECLNCPACFRKCVSMWSARVYIPFNNKSIIKKYQTEFSNCLIKTPRSENTLHYIMEVNQRS